MDLRKSITFNLYYFSSFRANYPLREAAPFTRNKAQAKVLFPTLVAGGGLFGRWIRYLATGFQASCLSFSIMENRSTLAGPEAKSRS
jgi:hypothetical protein